MGALGSSCSLALPCYLTFMAQISILQILFLKNFFLSPPIILLNGYVLSQNSQNDLAFFFYMTTWCLVHQHYL